jgi:hypothetical protein
VEFEQALKDGKNYLDAFFDATDTPHKYKCRECKKECKQDIKKAGYQGLKTHSQTHSNYKKQMERYLSSQTEDFTGPMFTYVREVSQKSKTLYGWIDLITERCLPFDTVKCKTYRKYTNLEPICVNTLKKYMKLLHR